MQRTTKSQGFLDHCNPDLDLPRYGEEQFLEVSVKVLPKLKIGPVIGKAIWDRYIMSNYTKVSYSLSPESG
ncbi:MAG TPA: hypothetical protein VEL11_14445 [Candidatus Bathyarchaeia archaeon]|nr:hypothetical protein [Candidatus Bathyarchaeia archaeon]